jgi:hypothetical protein
MITVVGPPAGTNWKVVIIIYIITDYYYPDEAEGTASVV